MARLTGSALLLFTGMALAQAPEKKPVFEAASVKPSDPTELRSFWRISPGRLTVQSMTLKSLVIAFYGVKQYQVIGGPRWLDTDRFDLVGKMEDDGKNPRSKDAASALLTAAQALLAERFQLLIHNETKLESGYALVTAKSGFKLKPAEGDGSSTINTSRTRMTAKGYSMERFAASLATQLERPVEDATGVEGAFDFVLEWSPDEAPGAAPSDKPAGPSLFTAIQETLGLKLEPRKVSVPIIVIDRVEKPGAN